MTAGNTDSTKSAPPGADEVIKQFGGKLMVNGVPNELIQSLGFDQPMQASIGKSKSVALSPKNDFIDTALTAISGGITKAIASAGGALDMNKQPEQALAANNLPQSQTNAPGKGGVSVT